jgi:hypothetical protein
LPRWATRSCGPFDRPVILKRKILIAIAPIQDGARPDYHFVWYVKMTALDGTLTVDPATGGAKISVGARFGARSSGITLL